MGLLHEVSKLLVLQDSAEHAAEVLVRRVIEVTGAERGFVVVREENGSFEQRFETGFDPETVSAAERRFSRNVVRQAIVERRGLYCRNLPEDPRFGHIESVQLLGRRSVLVVPLVHEEQPYGVLYLDVRRVDGFSEEARSFATDLADLAAVLLRKALIERARRLPPTPPIPPGFEDLITANPKMLALLNLTRRVADSDATVLLLGETGTGKELFAKGLHHNSARQSQPFVPLHCSALPTSLLESELFGHTRGAFTGADRDRPGRLASADGGTLFLDEIAELPLELQSKLLRFLQSGEIQRLGTDRVEKVDVRVIAATHADLNRRVQEGRFRQDLYFRLKVLELRLPPLRERRSDVPLLLEHFLHRHWRRPDESPAFTPRAEQALYAYEYPGNVRELEHIVERACLLASGPELNVDVLPVELAGSGVAAPDWSERELTNAALKEAVRQARDRATFEIERRFVEALLEQAGGNVSKASRSSGISRTRLQKLLARLRRVPKPQ